MQRLANRASGSVERFARDNIRNRSIRSATRGLRLALDINCSMKFAQLQGSICNFLVCGSECRESAVGGMATTKEVTDVLIDAIDRSNAMRGSAKRSCSVTSGRLSRYPLSPMTTNSAGRIGEPLSMTFSALSRSSRPTWKPQRMSMGFPES
jgi:hypothetical protein